MNLKVHHLRDKTTYQEKIFTRNTWTEITSTLSTYELGHLNHFSTLSLFWLIFYFAVSEINKFFMMLNIVLIRSNLSTLTSHENNCKKCTTLINGNIDLEYS